MTNFKQYYGTQRVEFAGAEGDVENVTVVYGENGKGKTTIYRAVVYALHGDKKLERDGQASKRKNSEGEILHIGNLAALEEDSYVDVSVVLAYEHNGKHYEIKRSMMVTLDGMDIEEADLPEETYLKEIDEHGRTNIYRDFDEINRLTGEALNRKMRQYFLFDGEQIEEMTKSTIEQRNQVREGIKKLLGIDSLYDSIEVVKGVRKHYQNKVKGEAKGEYRLALNQLDVIEQEIQSQQHVIEQLEQQIEQMVMDKENIEKFLEENKTVREKVKAREMEEEQLKALQRTSKNLQETIRKFGAKSTYLMAEPILQAAEADIEAERNNLGQSFNVSANLLREFLASERCGICGTPAQNDSLQYSHIVNALNNLSDSEYREALNELMQNTVVIQSRIEDAKQELLVYREELGRIVREMTKVTRTIEELDKEIGEKGDAEAKEKELSREKLIQKMAESNLKLEQEKQELVNKREAYTAQNRCCDELKKQDVSQTIFEDYKNFAEQTLKRLEKVKDTFTQEMVVQVSIVASRIFKQLLDEDSNMNFKGVIIKDDFSLDVQSFSNFDFLANISSGQRHILSISFILALLEISEGEDGQLKTPLFMDTPFGRISGENRDNLLDVIPQKAAQWILLVTDTEFTNAEVKALRPTKRWGKVYQIKLVGPGKAIIEEGNVATFTAKR